MSTTRKRTSKAQQANDTPRLEPTNTEDIRAWLKKSFQGAEWEDDDAPVDFCATPIDELLETVFDWHDERLSDALKPLGYSSEAISDFRANRFAMASAVEGPTLPIGYAATIDPTKVHRAARDMDHMLIIDGYELLRAARSFASQGMYTNTLRCLQLVGRHYSAFHQKRWPVDTGAKGGRASGRSRRKKGMNKLDSAAQAYGELLRLKGYSMREPKKYELETKARLPKGSLRKIPHALIRARWDELRERED